MSLFTIPVASKLEQWNSPGKFSKLNFTRNPFFGPLDARWPIKGEVPFALSPEGKYPVVAENLILKRERETPGKGVSGLPCGQEGE